jgi:NADH-quinone oxidoreductase subunit I
MSKLREFSPVYQGSTYVETGYRLGLMKSVQLIGLIMLCPVADITMKAEERKPDEKHLYREKNMLRL